MDPLVALPALAFVSTGLSARVARVARALFVEEAAVRCRLAWGNAEGSLSINAVFRALLVARVIPSTSPVPRFRDRVSTMLALCFVVQRLFRLLSSIEFVCDLRQIMKKVCEVMPNRFYN